MAVSTYTSELPKVSKAREQATLVCGSVSEGDVIFIPSCREDEPTRIR